MHLSSRRPMRTGRLARLQEAQRLAVAAEPLPPFRVADAMPLLLPHALQGPPQGCCRSGATVKPLQSPRLALQLLAIWWLCLCA